MKPKKPASKPKKPSAEAPKKHRVFGISWASLYPMYIKKVESKGRTQAELDQVLRWLMGYSDAQLSKAIATGIDLETLFANAKLNPNAKLITGTVCGVKLEEIDDPLMKKIRYMDKLVDELAKGKAMEKILRA